MDSRRLTLEQLESDSYMMRSTEYSSVEEKYGPSYCKALMRTRDEETS